MIKVLHITTSTSGGAGIACVRLHQALEQEKIESIVLALKDYAGTRKNVRGIKTFTKGVIADTIRKGKSWLQERVAKTKLKNQPPGFELFSLNNTYFDITSHPAYRQADIVNLHWISNFVDYTSFFQNNKKPVVWTLHDMFPFTGGCHHADGWNGFETDCAYCPQLSGTPDPSLASQQLQQKKIAMNGKGQAGRRGARTTPWAPGSAGG